MMNNNEVMAEPAGAADGGIIHGETINIEDGGAAFIQGQTVNIQDGGALIIAGQSVSINDGGGGIIVAENVDIAAGSVLLLVAKNVSGSVRVLIDARAAAVIGLVVGAALIGLKLAAGRK